MYDMKSINCYKCDKFIGEINYDAVVTLPKCGSCANLLPEGDDKVLYIVNKLSKNSSKLTSSMHSIA